jgi:hypothetical protein
MSINRGWVVVIRREDQGESEVEEKSIETPEEMEWKRDVLLVSIAHSYMYT